VVISVVIVAALEAVAVFMEKDFVVEVLEGATLIADFAEVGLAIPVMDMDAAVSIVVGSRAQMRFS